MFVPRVVDQNYFRRNRQYSLGSYYRSVRCIAGGRKPSVLVVHQVVARLKGTRQVGFLQQREVGCWNVSQVRKLLCN